MIAATVACVVIFFKEWNYFFCGFMVSAAADWLQKMEKKKKKK